MSVCACGHAAGSHYVEGGDDVNWLPCSVCGCIDFWLDDEEDE